MQWPSHRALRRHLAHAGVSMLLWLGLMLSHVSARAQVDPAEEMESYQFQDDGEEAQDSTKKRKVKEKTESLDPVALMQGYSMRKPSTAPIEQLLYTDYLDRQDGHSNRLGQWGMPYLRYRYGLDAASFDLGNFINPLTGAEDVYFIDPERGVRYFDTRTPFVNAYYGQGKANMGQMRAEASHNINHLSNASILYNHRQADGVYSNSSTKHDALGFSANFHTLNERYIIFAHCIVQQNDDFLHGGVVPLSSDSTFFGQGTQPVSLLDAKLRRFGKAVNVRQFYRITKDSLSPKHSLRLYNGYLVDYFLNEFTDRDVSSDVNTNPFPVYPNLGDSSYIYEKMELSRYRFDLGATYQLHVKAWESRQRLEIEQEWQTYKKRYIPQGQSRSSLIWQGEVKHESDPRSIALKWNYRQTLSNIFRPETYGEWELSYRLPGTKLDYKYSLPGNWVNPMDSIHVTKTHRPLGIVVHSMSFGRNPTWQQAYGTGWPGYNYVANPNLSNQRYKHFSIGLDLRGKSSWSKLGELEGNHLRLMAFGSRTYGIIYPIGAGGFTQAKPKEYVGYYGGELDLRLHWKVLYLEAHGVAQGFATNKTALETQFLRSQPRFYAKASLFYENRNLKFVNCLRFGVDYWYFDGYDAPYFDPSMQTFYAQGGNTNYFQFGYPRVDVYAGAQIKRAFLFARMMNLMENLPVAGYYTTMGYPMQVRQFTLGLNWSFFD